MKSLWGRRKFVHYLPVYGCISTGIIYGAVGVIAVLSFLKIVDGGADENSFLAKLHQTLTGIIFIWIILLGTLSYIIWRIYETIRDPYGYGKGMKGIAKRAGIALSTIADMLIVYAALQVIIGSAHYALDGQPTTERELVDTILQRQRGSLLIIVIGCVIIFTAIVQFVYGVTQGYKERTDMHGLSRSFKKVIHGTARFGYTARGFILAITGFFLVKSGVLDDASHTVNTDKAFDFIGDHLGHFLFIITALGTFSYGVFMMFLGITYDHDKD